MKKEDRLCVFCTSCRYSSGIGGIGWWCRDYSKLVITEETVNRSCRQFGACWGDFGEALSIDEGTEAPRPVSNNISRKSYDSNISDAFAQDGQSCVLEVGEIDCVNCKCFRRESYDCPVCPKNDDRHYATRCKSFSRRES
jgi:hypothetical protein